VFRLIRIGAVVIVVIGGLLGWLTAFRPLAETFAQDKKAEASDTPTAPVKVTIYDPDPQHLWNRLHRALWVRIGPDGKEYGNDRLDPLLWSETKYLLEGKSHEQAIAVLDEFLAKQGEKLVKEPLNTTALLQLT
jgi:hypothetical protein